MNKINRVTAALKGGMPDMVPFMFNTMARGIQEKIIGREIDDPIADGLFFTGWLGAPGDVAEVVPMLTAVPEVAARLNLDAVQIQVLPPIFTGYTINKGTAYLTNGLIDGAEAFKKIKMPDPDDDKTLRKIESMIKQYKGGMAMGARIRLGAAPSILSMGIENISFFYADCDDTLIKTVDMYTDWSRRMNKNLCELDFDFFWCFDDIAFTSNLLFSPAMFKEIFAERMKKAAAAINKPWIFHSDGNYEAVLADIIDMGANGIHPIEKSSMDTRMLKEKYGDKLCLVGNIDIDYTLAYGTRREVFDEVRECIALLGPGGRHIISDSNSIPDGCSAENVIYMAEAVEEYRHIY